MAVVMAYNGAMSLKSMRLDQQRMRATCEAARWRLAALISAGGACALARRER